MSCIYIWVSLRIEMYGYMELSMHSQWTKKMLLDQCPYNYRHFPINLMVESGKNFTMKAYKCWEWSKFYAEWQDNSLIGICWPPGLRLLCNTCTTYRQYSMAAQVPPWHVHGHGPIGTCMSALASFLVKCVHCKCKHWSASRSVTISLP